MKAKTRIDKGVVVVIVNLCFRINALKKLSMEGSAPNALLFSCVHKTIKEGLDATLGSPGIKGMRKEIARTKTFVKDTLGHYRHVPDGFGDNTKIISALDDILTAVTELEGHPTAQRKAYERTFKKISTVPIIAVDPTEPIVRFSCLYPDRLALPFWPRRANW